MRWCCFASTDKLGIFTPDTLANNQPYHACLRGTPAKYCPHAFFGMIVGLGNIRRKRVRVSAIDMLARIGKVGSNASQGVEFDFTAGFYNKFLDVSHIFSRRERDLRHSRLMTATSVSPGSTNKGSPVKRSPAHTGQYRPLSGDITRSPSKAKSRARGTPSGAVRSYSRATFPCQLN